MRPSLKFPSASLVAHTHARTRQAWPFALQNSSSVRHLHSTPSAHFFELPFDLPENLSAPYEEVPVALAPLQGALARAKEDTHRQRKFVVSTLRPERLTPADLIHLPRAAHSFSVTFESPPAAPPPTLSSLFKTGWGSLRARDGHADEFRASAGLDGERKFAAGLHGFLYYYLPPPHLPQLAGEVRLRVVAPDPAVPPREAFARGADYRLSSGLEWRIPLWALAWTPGYEPIRVMVLREGLVGAQTMRDAAMVGERHKLMRQRSRVVHSFGQPFVVDFSTTDMTFHFLGERRVFTHQMWNLCSWNWDREREAYQPFSGKALCCFERSTHPTYSGRVVTRVLKVLSAIERQANYLGPKDIPMPREGKLLYCGIHRTSDGGDGSVDVGDRERQRWKVWSADPMKVFRGMRVLFENEPRKA